MLQALSTSGCDGFIRPKLLIMFDSFSVCLKSLTVGLSQIYMLPGTYSNKQIERETLIKIRLRCHMTATILGALECWNSSCDVGSYVFFVHSLVHC